MTRAVFFDVDFTLIYPGPMFRSGGYRAFCERHGIQVDESRFDAAVASAAPLLDGPEDAYDAEIFVRYTGHIIEQMGGRGPSVDACARELTAEWGACPHFELLGLIAATVSSSDHGLMKPHPSIFAAALQLVNVPAADAVMVGDSVRHDVDGARRAGMRAVLLHRGPDPHPREREFAALGVPVIRSLTELPPLVLG